MALVHFELIEKQKGGVKFIPSSHSSFTNLMVKDDKGKIRELRYCDNETTIWKDEQNKDSSPTAIKINNNGVTLDTDVNPMLIEFLRKNLYKDKIYVEVDVAEKAKGSVSVQEKVIQAKSLIMAADSKVIVNLGKIYFPAISSSDLNILKERLYAKSDVEPEDIIRSLSEGKEKVNAEAVAQKAIDQEIIIESKENTLLIWKDTGAEILTKNFNKKPVNALREFLKDDSNKEVLDELLIKVGG